LKPLVAREVCSYRLEQYWTYELCHGKYLRQFHEDSASQKTKSQEYFLGKFDSNSQLSVTAETFAQKLEQLKSAGKDVPRVTVEGVSLPYIEFNFTGGTVCDVNNKPRLTRVLYVCSENAKHELHSIKETSTCEYEAIVLSPILCLHPDYKIESASENEIRCYPVGSAPPRPKDLAELESTIRAQSRPETLFDGKTIIFESTDAIGSSPGFRLIQVHDPETADLESLGDPSKMGFPVNRNPRKFPSEDLSLVAEFLAGDFCLQGVSCYCYSLSSAHHFKSSHVLNRGVAGGSSNFAMVVM
jgi:endoplasmic reticulum lectin 1